MGIALSVILDSTDKGIMGKRGIEAIDFRSSSNHYPWCFSFGGVEEGFSE